MGCASSKQKRCRRCRHCRHCHAPYSPMPRSYSMHVVHPSQKRGDGYHVVALTSTTLGSLALDSPTNYKDNINAAIDILTAKSNDEESTNLCDEQNGISNDKELKSKEFSVGLIEAKSWSNMIQEKIPKIVPRTPVRTPPGEPETINAWELMEGLEEDDGSVHLPHLFRSFSFDLSREKNPVPDSPRLNGTTFSPNNPQTSLKPLWLQLADEEANSKCPEFDPQIISTFRKSLQDLSPAHPFYLKPPGGEKQSPLSPPLAGNNHIKNFCKRGNEKVVVYFTSLRGIRKTYEDCCHVRAILKGLGVRTDERDVSMHSGFKDELRELLGEGFRGEGGLPKVFVGRKYIGGAEEIRRLHEEDQLDKLFEGCEMVEDSGGGACEACGDIRFVPCETCFGSCKIYYECDEEEEEEEECEHGFQRCPDCNENGLIHCPICCY